MDEIVYDDQTDDACNTVGGHYVSDESDHCVVCGETL